MVCNMPPTYIPDNDIKDSLIDSATLQPPAGDRRKRSVIHDDGDVILSELPSKRRLRTRRDASITTGAGKTMTVYVRLQFDNLQMNLTEPLLNVSTLLLKRSPSVYLPDSIINYYPGHDQIIEIQVTNFNEPTLLN
jgi:hypothetical protein